MENIKLLYESQEAVIKLFNDYSSIVSEGKFKSIHGEGLKVLPPKQMLQRLPIAIAQVKAGYTSANFLNEIKKIILFVNQINKKRYSWILKIVKHLILIEYYLIFHKKRIDLRRSDKYVAPSNLSI